MSTVLNIAAATWTREEIGILLNKQNEEIERHKAVTPCAHPNRRDVGSSAEGMGSIIVYWCPDCGALKRTMTNWEFTDYPWEIPSRAHAAQDSASKSNSPAVSG